MYMHLLDVLRTLTLGATAGTVFVALLGALAIRPGTRLALGAGIGAWISLVLTLTASGAVRSSAFLMPALFALPLVAAGIAASFAKGRTAMMAIPPQLIVSLNTWRVLGAFMVLAAFTGTMSGPFPYFAGIGDVITGILAFAVARVVARDPRDLRALEWNIFGALDLVVAVFLGVTTMAGSKLQVIHAGVGSSELTTLPWSLIPLVLVPTYLIGHALVFAHMRAPRRVYDAVSV
jgi:hypothetical protein